MILDIVYSDAETLEGFARVELDPAAKGGVTKGKWCEAVSLTKFEIPVSDTG